MESVDVFVKNQENKVYKSNFTFLIKRKAVILAAKSENVLSTKTIIIHLKQYPMNKKTTLRMVLTALLLVVGVNIGWAQTTLYERGYTTDWSDDDLTEWTKNGGSLEISGGLKSTGGNESYSAIKSLTVNQGSIIEIKATWNTGSSTGRAGSYNYLKIGDVELRAYGQDQKSTVVIGGEEKQLSATVDDVRGDKTWTIDITIDMATKDVSGSATLPSGSKDIAGKSTAGSITGFEMGFVKGGRVVSTYQTLNKIEITETEQSVELANYTVRFLDLDGNELRTQSVREGKVGDAVVITEADKADFFAGDNKYTVSHIDGENATIAADGSTVVTIYFETLGKFTAQVDAYDQDTEDLIQAAVGTAEGYEGDAITVYYPKGVKDSNGNWYLIAQNSAEPWYGLPNFEFGDTDPGEVFYTLNSDVKYYADVEKLTPSRTWAAHGGYPNRYSGGDAVRLATGGSVTTDAIEEAGTYYLYVYARNQSGSAAGTLNVYVVDAADVATQVENAFDNWNAGQSMAKKVEVTVPAGGKIKLENPEASYNSNLELDYLYLELKPEMYHAVFNAVDEQGSQIAVVKDVEVRKGTSQTVFFSKGLQVDNTWYMARQLSTTDDAPWYGATFEDENQVDVTFRKDESIVYFSEIEDLTPSRAYAATNSTVPMRVSNGAIGRLYKGTYVETASLAEGTYNITLWGRNQSGSSDANVDVYVKDASGVETLIENGFEVWAAGGAGTGEKTIWAVDVPAGGSIVLKNPSPEYNSNLEMDYIYLDTKPVPAAPTAIKNVQTESENGAIYNLQGQRVSQPERGIFVKNGKKVIVK